eukprot:scaffold55420_cov33-Prasinocladus_malaysianus.AAC.2
MHAEPFKRALGPDAPTYIFSRVAERNPSKQRTPHKKRRGRTAPAGSGLVSIGQMEVQGQTLEVLQHPRHGLLAVPVELHQQFVADFENDAGASDSEDGDASPGSSDASLPEAETTGDEAPSTVVAESVSDEHEGDDHDQALGDEDRGDQEEREESLPSHPVDAVSGGSSSSDGPESS